MDFSLEWEIKLFREEQPSLFDETGKRYSATPIGDKTAERMLNIINLFECAAAKRHEQESNCNKPAVSKSDGVEREALLLADFYDYLFSDSKEYPHVKQLRIEHFLSKQ